MLDIFHGPTAPRLPAHRRPQSPSACRFRPCCVRRNPRPASARSCSSTWAAACRITTASISSPKRRRRFAASTSRSPPTCPACRSANCCRRMAKVMDKVCSGALRRAQQRSSRDGHQLGAVRPIRLGRSATIPPSAPSSLTKPASAARCRRTSPFRAIRRSPGNSARAPILGGRYESFKAGDPNRGELQGPGRDAGSSRSAPNAPSAAQKSAASGRWSGRARSGQRPDRHLRRVPSAGRRHDPVERGPRRPSPSSRKPTDCATAMAEPPSARAACWPAG